MVAWAGLVVGTLMMVFGGPLVARSLAIAGGDGIPGYYQVTGEPDCSGVTSNCFSPDGTFTSDDRTVTRTSVQARLPKPVSRGDLYRTYDVGDDDEVYVKTNKGWHIAWPYWVFLPGLILFGLGAQHFWQNRRPRKRQEPDAT